MYRSKKNIIIGVMCALVLVMVVVYAAFMTGLTINRTGNITSTWSIEITSITSSITGTAYNISEPSYNSTSATFNAGLRKPGDKIEYSITIKNSGSVDAIINEVNIKTTGSYVIIYTIEEIQNQERLTSGASKTFKIIVEFDREATSIPSDTTKELIMDIECIQDDGQQLTPSDPNIDNEDTGKPTLVNAILKNNQAQSDENINFIYTSEQDGTKGLYYTNTNTEDNKTTYYFRGAVENNYVSFAGFYWRIIRINEDGTVRLIYQGTTPTATGNEATIGSSEFNTNSHDNAYVGYMYGTPGSSTYEETHSNINNSTVKGVVDTWYKNNLLNNYSAYIADSGFCGDRSLFTGTGVGATNETSYGPYKRLNAGTGDREPQFSCPQSNDLYTISSSNKGNKALDYPIGLITADEVAYAGGSANSENNSNYLNSSVGWIMSPYELHWVPDEYIAVNFTELTTNNVHNSAGIRPVINLKSTVEITSGDGTSSNPYVIKTN